MINKSNESGRFDGAALTVFALSLVVSYFALRVLSARVGSFIRGDVIVSLVVLGFVVVLTVARPIETAALFVALQMPLYFLANSGVIGNAMSSYVGIVVAGGLALFTPRRRRRKVGIGVVSLWLFAFAAFVAWIRAAEPMASLRTLLNCLAFVLVLSAPAIWSQRSIRRMATWFVAGTAGGCLATIVVTMIFGYSSDVRLGTEFGLNPGFLGYVAAFALIFIAGEIPHSSVLQFFYATTLAVAIVLSGGRGALLGAIVGGTAALIFARRYVLALILTIAVTAGIVWTVQQMKYGAENAAYLRMGSVFTESMEDSSAYRAEVWRHLLAQVPAHWAWGVGLGGVPLLTMSSDNVPFLRGVQSHNIYLTILLEMGALGFASFVVWQIRYFWFVTRNAYRHPLALPLVTAIFMEGFFSGLGLACMHAILLVAAYADVRDSSRVTLEPTRQNASGQRALVERRA